MARNKREGAKYYFNLEAIGSRKNPQQGTLGKHGYSAILHTLYPFFSASKDQLFSIRDVPPFLFHSVS